MKVAFDLDGTLDRPAPHRHRCHVGNDPSRLMSFFMCLIGLHEWRFHWAMAMKPGKDNSSPLSIFHDQHMMQTDGRECLNCYRVELSNHALPPGWLWMSSEEYKAWRRSQQMKAAALTRVQQALEHRRNRD